MFRARRGTKSRRYGGAVSRSDVSQWYQLLLQAASAPENESAQRLRQRLAEFDETHKRIRQQLELDVVRREKIAAERREEVPEKVPESPPPTILEDVPLKTDPSVPVQTTADEATLRGQFMTFLERRLWQDVRLRKLVCWLFPSAAMMHQKAIISAQGNRWEYDKDQIDKRLQDCKSDKTVLAFTVALENIYFFVLIDRPRRHVEVLRLSPGAGGGNILSFLKLNVVPLLLPSVPSSSFKYSMLERDCSALLAAVRSPFWCVVAVNAVLYLQLLNPNQSVVDLASYVKRRGPSYLTDYLRFIQSTVTLPPFRNVPLAKIADFSKYTKYSQNPTSMRYYLEYIAFRLQQERGAKDGSVCLDRTDPFTSKPPLNVHDPELSKAYASVFADAANPDLLKHIDECKARFFIAALSIRYVRKGASLTVPSAAVEANVDLVSEGHANVLIFDHGKDSIGPTLYRFEPNGPPVTPDQERMEQVVDNFVRTQVLAKLRRPYEYSTGVHACPYIPGAHAVQESPGQGGYCVSWSLMFAVLRLLNPDWPVDKIQERMLNAGGEFLGDLKGKERGRALLQYIQKFTKATDCVVPDFREFKYVREVQNVVRAMREDGRLAPRDCSADSDEWDRIYYYEQGSNDVFVGARTTCGRFVTVRPNERFGIRLLVTRTVIKQLTPSVFVRLASGSSPLPGSATLVGDPQMAANAIGTTVDYYVNRSKWLPPRDPDCPPLESLPK